MHVLRGTWCVVAARSIFCFVLSYKSVHYKNRDQMKVSWGLMNGLKDLCDMC
jgi:hypothetical protein